MCRVADRVTVVSQHNDGKQYLWESAYRAPSTVQKDDKYELLGDGSRISLHLKLYQGKHLKDRRIKDLVNKQ